MIAALFQMTICIYISKKKLKYISTLNKNQIPGIAGIDLSVFVGISLINFKARLSRRGYACYDESLYFKDLNVIENQRYVLGFSPVLFADERKCRNEKFASFENYLTKKNKELRNATHSRDYDKTRQAILNELKRLKIKKYFHDPVLTEITINKTNKRGKTISVQSFHVTVEKSWSR